MKKMSGRTTVFFTIVVAAFLTAIIFAIAQSRRRSGIAAVEEMGGTVEFKRLSDYGIPKTVCWVNIPTTTFDVPRINKLIRALRQIGIGDTRVNLEQSELTESEKKRIVNEVPGNTHLICATLTSN